jgi:hypothetical protein
LIGVVLIYAGSVVFAGGPPMLDEKQIEGLRECGPGKRVGRCPACADAGGDHKGEHLIIYEDGKFGCVLYPGEEGVERRRQIWKLVGIKTKARRLPRKIQARPISIRKA